ncbi:mkrn2 opposite strand protein [Holotrichia oblita]|uniref:Mkrn2 opposite strand protein n=1 Tax=Holotrichia oblita TaxID=644536 RepID=A0ACB9TFF8_HOLOL|nr:mkrn2 opposite strand protein [Holotrichia oblita]
MPSSTERLTRSATEEENAIQKTIEKVLSNVSFLNKIMETISTKIDTYMANHMKLYQEQLSTMQEELDRSNSRLDQLEQYSRLDSVRLFGLPEKSNENITEEVISILSTKLKLNIKHEDISICHRLNAREDGIKPVIIKFVRKSTKNEVYNAKSRLKGSQLIVREDLTKPRASMVRDLVKKFSKKNVFTINATTTDRDIESTCLIPELIKNKYWSLSSVRNFTMPDAGRPCTYVTYNYSEFYGKDPEDAYELKKEIDQREEVVPFTMDPGIVCFQHCGPKVFCFTLPNNCPVCGADLSEANFSLLPFSDYYNSMDLHIGLTTSSGTIVEFDKHGLRRHRSSHWGQCLLLGQASSPWMEHWDNTLMQVCKQKCWSARNYSEDRHNCYSFVLTFLQSLDYGNLSKAASNRTVFCEKFIVPRTTSAGKYISLYRKLKDNGYYVHRNNNYNL